MHLLMRLGPARQKRKAACAYLIPRCTSHVLPSLKMAARQAGGRAFPPELPARSNSSSIVSISSSSEVGGCAFLGLIVKNEVTS